MHEIVKMLRDRVTLLPEPAVFISGGLDSTIVLHHLWEQNIDNKPIHTFTFGFSPLDNEFTQAKQVAEHYGTIHTEVRIRDVLSTLTELYQKINFPRPIFNIWMYWPLLRAYIKGIKNVYFGEGLDEHFGGYWYKPKAPYQAYWADHWLWIRQPYEILAEYFKIRTYLPFADIDARETMPYWDSEGDKFYLRKAYTGILPKFVLTRKKKSQAPDWVNFYKREMAHIYGNPLFKINAQEVRECLNDFVTRLWLVMRRRNSK
jgi:asparagine synthetase B (glutamine-hydrolysing)